MSSAANGAIQPKYRSTSLSNRGNLSRILGELMLLIEPDKRKSEWAVKLAYAEKAEERFYVPENVFILDMMKTADRSLAVVDYALRRRFAFETVTPAFRETAVEEHLVASTVEEKTVDRPIDRISPLNDAIAGDVSNSGRGCCIRHSFFISPDDRAPQGLDWCEGIIKAEIVPLLEEYWFDLE